jgi:putative membrane protein
MPYLWLKAFHIFTLIAWMAGLFYLPRLFVYHADQPPGSDTAKTFAVMEHRLLAYIMRPAALGTILFGGALLSVPGIVDWHMKWIWVKLAAVLVLLAVHGGCEKWTKQFAAGTIPHSARFFRIVNEVPTVALIVIIGMVVLKPF